MDDLLGGLSRTDVVVNVNYKDKGGREYVNNYFLAKQKDMRYPEARIQKEIIPVGGGYEVILSSDVFARGVFVSIEGDTDNFVSDNYMDLLPGEPVKVRVNTSLASSPCTANLKVVSFSEMY